MAPSPFIATQLPSSLPVNMLNQISNYDLVDTIVTLKPTSRDIVFQGQMGVVKHIMTGDTASVHILNTNSDIRVPCTSLEPVRPRQKDVVKVVGGTHCLGRIGTLVSITGEYGIVKFMRGDNIAQIPIKNLGRYAPTRESGVKAVDYLTKSTLSASSSQPTSSSKEVSESPFNSINNSTTTNFPFVALHYPTNPTFPFLISGASPQGGSYVSLPGSLLPSSVVTCNDITRNNSPYSSASLFPNMLSSFMISPNHHETNSSNGMGTGNSLSSHSTSTSSDQFSSAVFPHSFMYPPMIARGHPIKSDNTSPTETTPCGGNGGLTPSFSFVRQDSTEKDSAHRSIPPESLLRPPYFQPAQHSRNRPSVIQSSSNQAGADPKHPAHQKGLLPPSSAIEKAKAFMATAMGVCPPGRGGGMVSRGGGEGMSSPMTRVHQHGGRGSLVVASGRAPPPYSTVKVGPRVSGHDHHQVKMNPEDRIRQFIEKLEHNRRSYAYRRNSGKIKSCALCVLVHDST